MTPDQISALAAAGESAELEFKKSTAEKERACRTLCAFANGRGGRLLFGVTPAGKVVGQIVADRTLEELARVRRPRLDITPLALGKERVEGQRGLAGTTDAGEDDQRVLGQLKVNAAQVMLMRMADNDLIRHGGGDSCQHAEGALRNIVTL